MNLRFEDARVSEQVPVCKRFRDGKKSRYSKDDLHVQTLPKAGSKAENREIHVFDGNVLLGRIVHVDPEKIETSCWNRTGEGPWALQPSHKYGFSNPEQARYFCKSILQAKSECGDFFKREMSEEKRRDGRKDTRVPLLALPFGTGDEFYPTPSSISGRMIGKINWKYVETVLEPSAGKGDLVTALRECSHTYRSPLYDHYRDNFTDKVDCIEIDPNLQALLKGLGFRVVADDFLSFYTHKKYNVIIMNPPFSEGDAHLLKAIELQEQNGGQICCLLNAETIRNPYTRLRRELVDKLTKYGAEYEYVKDGFRKAERTSDVETVIVWLTVPEPERRSTIIEELKKAPQYSGEYSPTALMEKGDWVRELIQLYNFEADAMVRLFREYQGLVPYLEPGKYDNAIIELSINGSRSNATINNALECLRERFWYKLLHDPQLEPTIGKMTAAMQNDYDSRIREMRDRDFSEYNIRMLILDIKSQLCKGIEDEIMSMFREMTKHALYDGCQNVHYYDGWKTNSAMKVNTKVILPFYGAFHSYGETDKLDEYKVAHYLSDLIKVMDYLDRGQTSWHSDLETDIRCANIGHSRRKVETTYFEATFFKKGTVHIKFRDDARHIIDRLNIFAATHQPDGQNWLPPYFGAVKYEDMDAEGKAVIDSFYGDIEDPEARHAEYEKVCQNPNYYLTTIDENSLLMLSAGE